MPALKDSGNSLRKSIVLYTMQSKGIIVNLKAL